MRARRRRGRGRERHPLRHQRLQPAAASSPRRRRPWSPALGDAVEVGIHTHNDAECAVANSLAAVDAGARLVQGCVNGYGERCGNANLASILPALQLKMGFEVVSDEQLASLTPTSHYLDELCNMTPNPDRAYVGRNAFAHKAGMHVAGVAADARTFEHLDPGAVGNERDILASELSGKATIRSQAERGRARARRRRPRRGRSSSSRSASTAATTTRRRRPPSSCCCGARRASTSRSSSSRASASRPRSARTARSRPRRRSRSGSTASATSRSPRATARSTPSTRALRAAIGDRHPHLADIELTNYKVRILDEDHGTGAVTRVLLDSSDGEREWGTIGVSENIIEASWEALVDSLEYAFQPRDDA